MPAHQDQVRLTLTIPPISVNEPVSLRLEGRATIGEQAVVRQAVPADDMMQAFAYRHLVPAQDLTLTAVRRGALRVSPRLLNKLPVKIPVGGTAQIQALLMPGVRTFEKVQLELSEPPEGISVREVSLDQQNAQIVLQADAAKVKPGLRGNLIVEMSGERTPPAAATKAKANRQRVPLGFLPAIPFEIVK